MTKGDKHDIPARAVIIAITLAACTVVWYQGLQTSPMMVDEALEVHHNGDVVGQENDPGSSLEHELAEAYWRRYPDIKEDAHYGINGPLGIFGAREHFRQHGKREGRVWGLTPGQLLNQTD